MMSLIQALLLFLAHFLMSRFNLLLASTAEDIDYDEYYNIKDSAMSLLDSWRKGQ